MATLGEMEDRIADDLNRTDLSTQIRKAINRAIEFYSKERFWFNENIWSFSASSATDQVAFSAALTTDLREVDTVTVTRSATDIYPLDQVTHNYLRQIATSGTSNTTGPPTDFAIFKNTWFFYPVPDQNYVVHVYGQKNYATLSATTSSNDFTTDAEDLIEARARWWLYANIIKDINQAGVSKATEGEALHALKAKTTRLLATGRIEPNE